MEEQNSTKKFDITSTDPENCVNLLKNISIENNNFLQKSEYRDKYDGTRLYNRLGPSEVYEVKEQEMNLIFGLEENSVMKILL